MQVTTFAILDAYHMTNVACEGFVPHDAALGANATHQMTEDALAERQAALYGDAGTNESFKVDIPPKQPTDKVSFLLQWVYVCNHAQTVMCATRRACCVKTQMAKSVQACLAKKAVPAGIKAGWSKNFQSAMS